MTIQFPIRQWWEDIANWIFPPVCVHCERVGNYLCPICWEDEVYPIDHNHLPTIPPIQRIDTLAAHHGAIRTAIHALKYEHTTQLAQPLGEKLAEVIQGDFDIIIPVPLHFSRLAERGYNQATLLAEALASRMKVAVQTDVLIRIRATESQVQLNAAQRHINLAGAFVVEGYVPARVLLVDDVLTTGATLEAAASALQAAGVEHIQAATVSAAQNTNTY